MKILIVDDSLMDRKLMANLIQKSGILNPILQAVDGEDALKVVSENYKDICLILLDWQMPRLNGIEFMKGVVKVPEVASIPIIMVTASGTEDDQKFAREINPNLAGYVVKPYKPDNLLSTIKPFLK